MKNNQNACLSVTLQYEGGISNHPDDPGGLTNKGVTQRVYDAYRSGKAMRPRSVRLITSAELFDIYDKQYWDRIRGDDLPVGVDLVVFDYAVNSGVSKAGKDLQRALGVTVDGVIATITLEALKRADPDKVIKDLCARRLRFLKSLKTWRTFGGGWASRVGGVEARAVSMRGPSSLTVPTPVVAPAKAKESAVAASRTPEGIGLTATAAAAGGQSIMGFAQQMQPHIGQTLLGKAALTVFILLAVIGGLLIGYSYMRRIKESGGLGGFIGSVFRGQNQT